MFPAEYLLASLPVIMRIFCAWSCGELRRKRPFSPVRSGSCRTRTLTKPLAERMSRMAQGELAL